MKTLKVEEVDGRRYRNFDHAESCIGTFIEEIYNQQRLHSALDYRSPMEFEADLRNGISEEIGHGPVVSVTIVAYKRSWRDILVENFEFFTKKEKRSKKERKGRPVETAAAVEIGKRWPSATFS